MNDYSLFEESCCYGVIVRTSIGDRQKNKTKITFPRTCKKKKNPSPFKKMRKNQNLFKHFGKVLKKLTFFQHILKNKKYI